MIVLAAFAAVIVVGEWMRIAGPGIRDSAPLSTSAAAALMLSQQVPTGTPLVCAPTGTLVLAATAIAVGALTRRGGRDRASLRAAVGRIIAIGAIALLFRVVVTGNLGLDVAQDPQLFAAMLVVVTGVGLLADIAFTALLSAARGPKAVLRRFIDESVAAAPIHLALSFSAPIIALAAGPLGLAALPVFIVPMLLTQLAYRRYISTRLTYDQGLATLSRITEVTGHTLPGHAESVADLAVDMGRELGLAERALRDLHFAGLLHDLGQVALPRPIPQGATVLAAPVDQRRIQHDTVHLVRATGVLDDAAAVLAHQATPYRNLRELGEQVPLASRIIKVANAYVDLLGDPDRSGASVASRRAALERIHLGLGYEYDPQIVAVLERLVSEQADATVRAGERLTARPDR